MEDEKFLGEPSNLSNNRSLVNNSSSANSINSTSSSGSNRPSSSSNLKQNSAKLEETIVYDGDDVSWWDCSLCTYKNSADKFKCDICDLRRGTSTRKPRCNADTIVAQVVKQQEQIRQQTKVKTPKIRTSTTGFNIATSSNDSTLKPKVKSRETKGRSTKNGNTDDESDSESAGSPKAKRKKIRDAKHERRVSKNHGDNEEDSTDSECTDVTDDLSPTSTPQIHRSASESSLASTNYSLSSAITPEPTIESSVPSTKVLNNPFKITPLEVSGNLIKYSPPTSSGRTGLIIDKKRFTQHSVTVNDVTIKFTEFATRQNKYVRKKKKRRDASRSKSSVGIGKSRAKPSDNASSTATGDT